MVSIFKPPLGGAPVSLKFSLLSESDRGQWLAGQTQWSRGALRFHFELSYRLFLPKERRGSMPLLVMLHGCKQDAQSFAEGTQMNRLAERHGFGVLYPEQRHSANPYSCWNWFLPAAHEPAGEAGAIAQLVQEVTTQHALDPDRIYVAGMSAGAAMARILAVRYGALFAGCAAHSGLMYRAAASPMQAGAAMQQGSRASPRETAYEALRVSRPGSAYVPTLVIHGDRDEVVRPVNAEQIVEQCRALAERQAPSMTPLIESTMHRITRDDRPYRLRDYTRQNHVLLRMILIEGLGHAWSGGDARHPFNDGAGPSASELIWAFLRDHARQPQSIQPISRPRRWPALLQRWTRW